MLEGLLVENRRAILRRWFHLIIETYPPDTAQFLEREKDRFANPVADTVASGIEAIYDELTQGRCDDGCILALTNITKLRAVQELSPAQAIGFVFLLKKAVREELANDVQERQLYPEMLEFDSRVDEAALVTFDIFMKCREQIYQIRANEIRNRSVRIVERINLVHKMPGHDRRLDDHSLR